MVSITLYLMSYGWCTWVLYASTSVGGEVEWFEKGSRVLVLCVKSHSDALPIRLRKKSSAFLAGYLVLWVFLV